MHFLFRGDVYKNLTNIAVYFIQLHQTMFKHFSKLKIHHRLLFSLIIMSGMVCLWRGMWGLLDLYLFVNNPALSFSLSLLLGCAIITITHYTIDKLV